MRIRKVNKNLKTEYFNQRNVKKGCYFTSTKSGKIKKSEKYKSFASTRAMETSVLLVGIIFSTLIIIL